MHVTLPPHIIQIWLDDNDHPIPTTEELPPPPSHCAEGPTPNGPQRAQNWRRGAIYRAKKLFLSFYRLNIFLATVAQSPIWGDYGGESFGGGKFSPDIFLCLCTNRPPRPRVTIDAKYSLQAPTYSSLRDRYKKHVQFSRRREGPGGVVGDILSNVSARTGGCTMSPRGGGLRGESCFIHTYRVPQELENT